MAWAVSLADLQYAVSEPAQEHLVSASTARLVPVISARAVISSSPSTPAIVLVQLAMALAWL